ncbi:peptide chain release factor N(5)-glutamine methyltransferase [Clostridium manihotivorum]|uniref:Release factor glutamine methyltransferase n=1 Tax=Clostridium manihotivorum TaxID=2320868 RepID=A0A3R5TEB2_9CLOT|nr:peptide chain release factor N(5)-glutamine methyltransferase [Clostridium manihotivorum]QAA31423.1 peptide chain release factor N(5)-glutamine methyltransferase [Clostridium manihotivorum]
MRKTKVGGQAVLEGVMMRGVSGLATAVRTPDGRIEVDFKNTIPVSKKHKIFALPVIRGFFSLVDSMVEGIKCINYSASFFEDEDETSKFDKWIMDKFGDKSNDIIMGFTLILSLVFSVGLFLAIPTAVTSLFKHLGLGVIGLNIIEGVIRVIMLLGYMYIIGRLEDINRLYQYHGAEHKTIFCYENEMELTVENVRKFQRFHPRCGTNFMFLVMLVSIFAFSFTGWNSLFERIISRVILLPLVSGVTYELIRWIGKSESVLSHIIAAPGLKLQNLTTREPDDDQIEVAIRALKAAEGIKDDETIGQLLNKGNEKLKEASIDSYVLDCQLILGKVIDKDKLYLITHREELVEEEKCKEFYDLIEKRQNKMPIKYILESSEFFGVDLYIKQGVLIPRADTEILVEEVLGIIDSQKPLYICDLCCGSGAIGIAIAKNRENAKVDFIDIEDVPEFVTKTNIEKLGLEDRCTFVRSNLLEEVIKENKVYDVIVSNPPYIKEAVIPTLMEDVKDYEPHIALSGGADGLDFYRKIIEDGVKVLKDEGTIAFEIGYDQGEDVKQLLLEKGFKSVKIVKDLAALDRVVIAVK